MDLHPTKHSYKNLVERHLPLKVCCYRYMLATFIAFMILMDLSNSAFANDIVIVSEADSKIQQSIISSFQRKLPRHSFGLLNVDDAIYKHIVVNKPDLIVTLGYKAANRVPKDISPLLHTFISKNDLKKISLCQFIICFHKPRQIAIQLDQPAMRQINLIGLLFPKAKKIGTLLSNFSEEQKGPLSRLAKDKSLGVRTETINISGDINRQLNRLLKDSKVILAVPDPVIYNRFTIPQILLKTYHRKIPLIGFSKSFVDAGAIAAVYSTPEQISQQISEVIALILSDATYRPSSLHPAYFDIAIHRNVARSLQVKIPPLSKLRQSMIEMEK